ncbi:thiazole biosynthesis protein ThiJ [Bacteroidia bacterium]|nr:thiazole biosynthesis protein ThiJ [Bacteroidia bacterium]
MQAIYVFLANGFEEIEALTTVDVLRRAGLETITVSIHDEKTVVGAHGIPVVADERWNDEIWNENLSAAALVLPGGMPGAMNLGASQPLLELLAQHYSQSGLIAAICAAPAMVLRKLNLKPTTKLTCYPGFEVHLSKYTVTDEGLVVDGNIITAKGPAYACDFALSIVEQLKGKETAKLIAEDMLTVW